MNCVCEPRLRLGKIGYLNVLPIYHPLESGAVPNNFEIMSGPPSSLNKLMAEGFLDLSANSSIEYARHAEQYALIPDLAIGSRGPVMSVLLISRREPEDMDGREVVVSAQTHTSAALLKVLFDQHLRIKARFTTADAGKLLAEGGRPEAILAIGDEALSLRGHPDYPHCWDLGEAWRSWTGLPFIFGVWLMSRDSAARREVELRTGCETLLAAKAWGVAHLDEMAALAAETGILSRSELTVYFQGLCYDLGGEEQEALRLFYDRLVLSGLLPEAPDLRFF